MYTQYSNGTKFAILSPLHLVRDAPCKKKQLKWICNKDIQRIWHSGEFIRIDDFLNDSQSLSKCDMNDIWLMIDRLSVSDEKDAISRLMDSGRNCHI